MKDNSFYFMMNKSFPEFKLSVELNLIEGEFFSLLGPSGCGKTTLLRLIAGFEQNESGSVIINGEDVSLFSPLKRKIGMVFQEYALFPHLNVTENIVYGLRAQKYSAREIRNKLGQMLDLFELKPLEKRNIQQLSGGERQRVALARSIITEPHILLLDEPFAALDYNLRGKLRQDLRDYQKKLGITTIFVTHQQEEALILSDRLGVMKNGRLLQVGSSADVYEKPSGRFVAEFLGEANFIQGTVRPGLHTADLAIGRHNPSITSDNIKLARTQGTVEFMVRPENIMVNLPCPKAVSFLTTVTRIDYMGYMYRIETLTDGFQPFIVYLPKISAPIKVGAEIRLTIPNEAFKAFAET